MHKKIISLFLIGILLLVLSINCFADSTVELTSILSNSMDFDKCKVIIGTDYKQTFKEEGDWLINTIPVNTLEENKINIKIKVLDCDWVLLLNETYILDHGDNEIIFDYTSPDDKKINVKINIFIPNDNTPTETPILTETPIETTADTTEIINTDIQSTSTPINETLEPTSTQTEELPKTGDESSMVMAVLSFLMIGSGSGILYFTRKKES